MTDRPALARALIDLVVTMTRRKMPPQTSEVAAEVKRVLAEHKRLRAALEKVRVQLPTVRYAYLGRLMEDIDAALAPSQEVS